MSATAATGAPVLNGAPPRQLTDPRSLTSVSTADASPVSIPDLYFARTSYNAVWSPDGKTIYISTDLTGRLNLWSTPSVGGFPLQLTQSGDPQVFPVVAPDGGRLYWEADHDGNETYDLYTAPTNGGPTENLTSTPTISENYPEVSFDNKMIAFERRGAGETSANVAVMDLARRSVRVLTDEKVAKLSWHVVGFTKDSRSVLANRSDVARTESSIWLIDVATGTARSLTNQGAGVFNSASDISPDGLSVAITTLTASGVQQAAILSLKSGAIRLLSPSPWEQKTGEFSRDGQQLLVISNVDGRDEVSLYGVRSKTVRRLALPAGVNSGYSASHLPSISPDGSRVLFAHESGSASLDYWTYDLSKNTTSRITRLGLASIEGANLPKTEVVHYASFDGTVISALLWLPFNLRRDGHSPAIVIPHVSPTSQTRDLFDRTAIAFATRGYLVIEPNSRGAAGYGQAFSSAIRHDLGGGDVQDLVFAAKFLNATGYTDPKKIGIYGGSYGGYLTIMALAKTPDVWAAGAEWYGMSDWATVYAEGSASLRPFLRTLIGDPVADKATYQAASTMPYLAGVRAPLLVLQGDNDVAVPKSQATRLVEALTQRHANVEAHYYPNEGHGFFKRENQIDALERTVAWFDSYLKSATGSDSK